MPGALPTPRVSTRPKEFEDERAHHHADEPRTASPDGRGERKDREIKERGDDGRGWGGQ